MCHEGSYRQLNSYYMYRSMYTVRTYVRTSATSSQHDMQISRKQGVELVPFFFSSSAAFNCQYSPLLQ